jgi:KUP system potassium uptake protein
VGAAANAEHNHTLHEAVLIVAVDVHNIPVVSNRDRVSVDDLGYADDGIFHVTAHYGFDESPDVPAALAMAARRGLECAVDLEHASYFVSRIALRRDDRGQPAIERWRKTLFLTMARHAANPVEYFNLPIDRTVVMGGHVTL